jgi:hypothetical protein
MKVSAGILRRLWRASSKCSSLLSVFSHKYARNKAAERSKSGGKIDLRGVAIRWSATHTDGDTLMSRTGTWITLGLLLSAPLVLAQNALAQNPAAATAPQPATPPVKHHKPHKMQPLVLPPLAGGPLRQLPMDQLPPAPAKVGFQDGLLTISAQNSTLGEILRDVRQLTGASIEIPPSAGANERVVAQLGPGAPRDVLAGLLNGSSFNYVMLGSSADPSAVASVILTPKPSVGGETQVANVNPPAYDTSAAPVAPTRFPGPSGFARQAMVPSPVLGRPDGSPPPPAASADADDKDDDSDSDDKDDDSAPAQPAAAQTVETPDANANGTDPNAGPKTPEQIMEMLRRSQPNAGPASTNPPAPPTNNPQ